MDATAHHPDRFKPWLRPREVAAPGDESGPPRRKAGLRRRTAAGMIAALSASCAAGQAPLPASEHVGQPEAVALAGAAPSTAGELAPEAVQPAVVDEQASAVAEPLRQIRAVWVDAFHDGVKSLAQVDRLIADCRLGGINTIIVQVRRR